SVGVGRFAAEPGLCCARGDRVVVESRRGMELGAVLCPTTPRHARLLPDPALGRLVRLATAADETEARRLLALSHILFAEGRRRGAAGAVRAARAGGASRAAGRWTCASISPTYAPRWSRTSACRCCENCQEGLF